MYYFPVYTEVNCYSVFSPSLTLCRNNKIPQLHNGSEPLDSFHFLFFFFYSQVSVHYLVNFGMCSLLRATGFIWEYSWIYKCFALGKGRPHLSTPRAAQTHLDFQGKKGFLGIAVHGMKLSALFLIPEKRSNGSMAWKIHPEQAKEVLHPPGPEEGIKSH